jgi:Type I restriction modification DNA specificity domain
MKRRLLLDNFDRLTDAAGSAPLLRRFILDLAVHGLVGCSSAAAQRQSDNGLWPVPSDWEVVALNELASDGGLFVDGDWVETKDQDPDGDVRLTQLADVGVGVFRDRSSRYMRSETAARLRCTYLETGDILIARMPDPIGRACRYPGAERPAVTAVDVAILRPARADVDADYVVHALNSPSFLDLVLRHVAGTTRQRISRGNLSRLPFPLPSLREQKTIVANVDGLLRWCEAMESAQAKRDAYRESLLKSLMREVLATVGE